MQEQDNTALAIKPDGSVQALAREHGINSYTRIAYYNFTSGRAYWKNTQAYWEKVRI
ncbi:DUF6607 family protein [Pseudolysobacter antarcticus]|uniref:DUF6607 family protein n=1 Tax=Pseudolysobacter antarcticus TaxID=2511995 RepID=UPI0013EADC9B|nr:DUF6607 family protein [Pseudolysobacter antarcticus]